MHRRAIGAPRAPLRLSIQKTTHWNAPCWAAHVTYYRRHAVLALVALLAPRAAAAQVVPPPIGEVRPTSRVWAEGGWDPTFALGAGISTRLPFAQLGESTSLDYDAAVFSPLVLLPKGTSWQVALGLTLTHVTRSGLGVSAGLHPDWRTASDDVATSFGPGLTTTLRPGYYGKSFDIAAELVASSSLGAWLRPRQPVYDLFAERYGDGVDGRPRTFVRGPAAHRFRFGLVGGFSPTRSLAFHASLGFAYTPQLAGLVNPPYGPLPFFATLGGSYRW